MEPSTILLLLLLGLFAGFMSSLVGIGGGIIMVPGMVLLLGFNQKLAQGSSLLVLCLPVAAMGAYAYYKAGNVDWRASLFLALSFVVGGYLGGLFVNKLDNQMVKKIFALFLLFFAIKTLFFDKKKPLPPTTTINHNISTTTNTDNNETHEDR